MKKKIFLTTAYFLICYSTYCQFTAKIYFDKDWKKTFNRKDAEYYRIVNFDSNYKPVGTVKDYYMDGTLQYEALKTYVDTVNPKLDTVVGDAKWYAKNGQLTRQSFFKNGKLEGEQKRWYEDGVVKSIAHYEDGKLNGEFVSFNPNGNYQFKINYNRGIIVGKKAIYYTRYLAKCDYFFDDFNYSDNPYEWKIPDNNDGVKAYVMQDTGMYIQNNSKEDLIAHMEIPLTLKTGFDFFMKIKKDSGDPKAGYGIVFDYSNELNYSYFLIRSDGYYLTGRKLNGYEMSEVKWQKTKSLLGNSAYDKLQVYRSGLEIKFKINDKEVAKGSYVPFTGSRIGVLCQKGDQSIILRTIYCYQY